MAIESSALKKQPSRAKSLSKGKKGPFVLETFRVKVEAMERSYEIAKSAKNLPDYWPKTLEDFREWDDPGRGIFKFSDPTLTSPKCPQGYKLLRERLNEVRRKLSELEVAVGSLAPGDTVKSLKAVVAAQSEQLTRLLMFASEFRDEIARLSPKSKYLTSAWDLY
ncbi:hypothetical protein [Rhizobium ruizarguesonis]|uniref:hypothetical protein n=1 Tax=Rhizobium ruizarguesonis TaxID=2081791 RepID=UPI00103108EE|nr:hypothetical protein [Rhizobium ruizarguesonis]TBC80943.1 hypothetical protein ELH30_24550 [Rhizobium ruizarguesonis]